VLPIEPPPSRRQQRPVSPITFAQNPKHRPISPITFAPARPSGRASDDGVGSQEGRTDEESSVGLGYEEDDEWDADDTDEAGDSHMTRRKQYRQRYRRHDPGNLSISSTSSPSRPATHPNQNTNIVAPVPITAPVQAEKQPKHPPQSKHPPTYLPKNYTVIRFSTGQILEDDFTIAWYDLRPYELLEVHRAGVVLRLPRQVVAEYVAPYWEGWVKALRVVERDMGYGDGDEKGNRDRKRKRKGDGMEGFGKRDKGRTKLEWRDRWVVIREGMLSLCQDSSVSPRFNSIFGSSICDIVGTLLFLI